MSIGNLRDSGNKGNNFPYQLANLRLLDDILLAISSSSPIVPAGTISDAYFSGATNAATIVLYQTWRAANPTKKVIARTMMVDPTTLVEGMYIEFV